MLIETGSLRWRSQRRAAGHAGVSASSQLTFQLNPTQCRPVTVAVRCNQAFAYASNENGTVSVMHTGSNSAVATINVGGSHWGIALIPDDNHAHVPNHRCGYVKLVIQRDQKLIIAICIEQTLNNAIVRTRCLITHHKRGCIDFDTRRNGCVCHYFDRSPQQSGAR